MAWPPTYQLNGQLKNVAPFPYLAQGNQAKEAEAGMPKWAVQASDTVDGWAL